MKNIFQRVSAAVIALAVMLTAVVFDVPWKTIAAADVGDLASDGWTIDGHGKLTIANDTGMANWKRVKNSYKLDVTSVQIESEVTSIATFAFNGFSELESV